jgi:hypothetical protein
MKIKSYYSPAVEDAVTMAPPEARHLGESAGLARFLAARSDAGTPVALSSSMKSADLTGMADSL